MKRADSHLRSQPAQVPKKKAAPPPLTIPKPAHQPRRQHEPNSVPEDRQNDQNGVQGSARHQGWNPLKQSPRQHNAVHGKDSRGGRDLERQGEFADLPKVKDRHELVSCILLMIVGVLGVLAVVVLLKTTWGKG